jgi:hypothetical protein
MKISTIATALGAALFTITLTAQESKPVTTIRGITDRAGRGTLNDARQLVRGDSGKWNDKATLQLAPPMERKPQGMSLDDWAEQLAETKFSTSPQDDNWVIFRSRQLDDHDRVWVEAIERRGNEFTIVMNEAIWKGRYFKSFTGYEVIALNLGKLPAGDYAVKWVVKPLVFERFEDPGKPQDNWPKDERAATEKPGELTAVFSVKTGP